MNEGSTMSSLVICGSPALGMTPLPSRLEDASTPLASATDLGLTRGDGIFESVGVHRGEIHDLEPHLERLAQSARMLDLPAPDLDAFREAILMSIEHLLSGYDEPPVTALCKVVYTRGLEAAASTPPGQPLGFALAYEFPDPTLARSEGCSAVMLSRGYPLRIGTQAPWLTIGAKTLSYAVNMAALRHAASLGAEEVIFTTTDGFVLEAPRSTVLLRIGDTALTPAVDGGLLHGTAQQAAFEAFEAEGLACEYRDITVEQLASADAVWLADSAFLLRPVHTLNGRPVEVDRALTAAGIARMLGR